MTLGQIDCSALITALVAEAEIAGKNAGLNVANEGSKDNYVVELVTAQILVAFAAAIHQARKSYDAT